MNRDPTIKAPYDRAIITPTASERVRQTERDRHTETQKQTQVDQGKSGLTSNNPMARLLPTLQPAVLTKREASIETSFPGRVVDRPIQGLLSKGTWRLGQLGSVYFPK